MPTVRIPTARGDLRTHELREPAPLPSRARPPRTRSAYAAAHVVADPLKASADAGPGAVDWERTLEQRTRLWDLGLGVAEAMDTAQRGMGITWGDVQELVRMTLEEAERVGGQTVVGVATDHLEPGPARLPSIIDTYLEQLTFVEEHGGSAVLMASRQLAASAESAEDYREVYGKVLESASRPVVLHWLGEPFDPDLAGYWGAEDPREAVPTLLELIEAHQDKVAGIKVSVLDAQIERDLRSRLPEHVKTFTGDDYNYVDLLVDEDGHHSHALLGAFAAVAPFAAESLRLLDEGDTAGFRALLEPTQRLSRLVFARPTSYYKTGIAWLSFLSGHQPAFRMLGGLESGRSVQHLVEVFREADGIGLFPDPELTAARLGAWLRGQGIG